MSEETGTNAPLAAVELAVAAGDGVVTTIAPSRKDVAAAYARLTGRIRRTPMLDLPATGSAGAVSLKLECLQASGSFKIRGATNRILVDGGRHERVVAVSGGNHGTAVACAARELGVVADIFVPNSTPPHKIAAIRRQRACCHVVHGGFEQAVEACRAFAAVTGALLIHPFDDPGVIAGQGSLGLEIVEQRPDVTTVIVAVGGGGLAAGVALALGSKATVVAAEPALCPSLREALSHGRPVPVPVGGAAADSLGAPMLGIIAYEILASRVHTVVSVSEGDIARAQRELWHTVRLAVEPAAACAWAAAKTACAEGAIEHPVVVVCGANVQLSGMADVLGDFESESEDSKESDDVR